MNDTNLKFQKKIWTIVFISFGFMTFSKLTLNAENQGKNRFLVLLCNLIFFFFTTNRNTFIVRKYNKAISTVKKKKPTNPNPDVYVFLYIIFDFLIILLGLRCESSKALNAPQNTCQPESCRRPRECSPQRTPHSSKGFVNLTIKTPHLTVSVYSKNE